MNKFLLRSILWLIGSLVASMYVVTFEWSNFTDLQLFAFMYAIWFSGAFTAYYNYDKYKQSKKVTRWHD